jgi:signal transduction histidine kinase
LAGWLLRPVGRLDEAAHQISAGDLSARVPAGSGPPELRRLEHTFNEMAVHVQEAVEAQRAFVADASHQLRNPMAALLIRLEGLSVVPLERVGDAARSALGDGRNLAATLDRMLELARIEHVGTSAGAIDVARLVDDRLESWRVVAEHRSIRIHRVGLRAATGQHEPGALAGAIDAVVDNAIKYSPTAGTVTVEVAQGEGSIAVVVTDDGPGVATDDLPHLAERFWRSHQVGAQSGTGLGMSIAKALLERYGGRLELATTSDRGLRVSLLVPRNEMDGAEPASSARPHAGSRVRIGQDLVRR